MQFFLQDNKESSAASLSVVGRTPSNVSIGLDVNELEKTSLRDDPLFTSFVIDINEINFGGEENRKSYPKAKLLKIARELFSVKTVGENKKEDLVRFLLDPRRIKIIEYNNLLLETSKQRRQ